MKPKLVFSSVKELSEAGKLMKRGFEGEDVV